MENHDAAKYREVSLIFTLLNAFKANSHVGCPCSTVINFYRLCFFAVSVLEASQTAELIAKPFICEKILIHVTF